ncbi:valine--tRNA ligase [Candidatus Dependentiae bacterium]|nr:valine--tRNA ligase [Candidatus Dependentiae bacterium]MBU4387222.1 valine--tRNA ligase [Candidatus Dependentiae bacterium]
MDKHYEHIKFEREAQELWDKEQVYKFDEDSKKPTFSIDTPPPTVSGTLHTGHIFSYTHTDIIARYKRLLGFNIFYPMGFDDNGLPTERFVEKQHGIKGHMMKRSEFIKLCLSETAKVEKEFENLWKKMGLSIDWTKIYSTIEDKVRKISQYSFIDLYNKGFIYRKEEPSLYCTTCRTTVAQAEMDDAEISSTFNDIEFETANGEKLIIATTRPELLPACVALFFNPQDTRYKKLLNKKAIVPVFGHEVPILQDDKVDMQKGTGLVMCCTFGDQTDIYWYKTHKLPFIQAIGFDGIWTEKTGPLSGLKVQDARKKVLELLQVSGKLLAQKKIVHNVGVHERCKQEIEYLILKQWFVKILDHKKEFLALADKIEWKPEFMKARYKDWVENLNWDWCISRQRFYGIPFPVWHCQDCGHVILADEKDLPIDPQETNFKEKCPNCSSANIKGDTDIMDTWNTSSITPQINTNWPQPSHKASDFAEATTDKTAGRPATNNLNIPMSMRPQAHDIIRTWAFYTIVKSYYHNNDIPWKEIVISGHVLSGKEKISKSKGNSNVPGPEKLLETYPADVIRYWSANGKLGTDTAFSENQLKIGQRLITKLWNAFRFFKDHLASYEKFNTSELKLDNLSKWVLQNFATTVKSYKFYFDQYNYTQALEEVEKFFWNNFCDNYLELIKDQIFNPSNYDEKSLQNTKFVLYEVGFGLLELFSPFLPHITETLYQSIYKSHEKINSLSNITFDFSRFNFEFKKDADLFNKLIELISQVRKFKTENQLSLKTELESLNINSKDKELLELIKREDVLLKGITKAKEIIFSNNAFEKSGLNKIDEKVYIEINLD